MISLRHVGKKFGSLSVLRNVNLDIKPHEFLTILGPSGCGKSTLLRILAQLENPSQGQWQSQKKNLNFSFVFQEAELLPWLNVSENIGLPLTLIPKVQSSLSLEEVLALVQLSSFKDYYPHQLSGGMKMRTSIARALITNPDLLLMDEPFSSLDENTRYELQEQLLILQKKKKITVVFVTHSIQEAVYLSDRVQVFSAREGCSIHEEEIHFEAVRDDKTRMTDSYKNYVTNLSRKMKDAKTTSEPGVSL